MKGKTKGYEPFDYSCYRALQQKKNLMDTRAYG
jgi:hypothetical protein